MSPDPFASDFHIDYGSPDPSWPLGLMLQDEPTRTKECGCVFKGWYHEGHDRLFQKRNCQRKCTFQEHLHFFFIGIVNTNNAHFSITKLDIIVHYMS